MSPHQDPVIQRVGGIRCTGCGSRYPDLPEWQDHLDPEGECPEGDR